MKTFVLAAAALLLPLTAEAACPSTAGCPIAAQQGTQPCSSDMKRMLERASRNRLYASGPSIAKINRGCVTPVSVDATAPCVLTEAIGWVESTWQQYCAANGCGSSGPTVISFDCGYGVMQVTSGMKGGAGFEPFRVASEINYNLGTGVKILMDKWRAVPCVGDRQPNTIEDWYFAVWAYNGFSYINNPNNSTYPSTRPPYNGPGSLSRGKYPYQEIVWGYMRYPPSSPPKWTGVAVSYPDKTEICTAPAGTTSCKQSAAITEPTPVHTDACQTQAAKDDAELAGEAPPNPIVTAQGHVVKKTFKVRNTGDTVWSKADGFALVMNSSELAQTTLRVELPDGVKFYGEDVAPLEVSFLPDAPGPKKAVFQMVHGNVKFGPELLAQVNVSTDVDADGDGFAQLGKGGADCNDDDPLINPGATEACDGRDNDCDGKLDNGLTRTCSTPCGVGQEVCVSGAWQACTAAAPKDEVCNGRDDDCNALVDDGELCADGEACSSGECRALPPEAPPEQGCGCASASGAAASVALLALGMLRRRRS